MPILHFKYGPRPGEGYGIIEESAEIDPSDRDPLVKFCKAIRWRPEKRNLPNVYSFAIVPAPNHLWLCRIDETKDDRGRHLAYVLQADGYVRSDDSSIHRLRESIAQHNVPSDTLPDIDKLASPEILLHAELVYYSHAEKQLTRKVQPTGRQNQEVRQNPRKPCSFPPSSPPRRARTGEITAKTAAAFIVGVTLCSGVMWVGIIQPKERDNSQYRGDLITARKQISELEEVVNQWETAAKMNFPGVSSSQELSDSIQEIINEVVGLRRRMEVAELAATLTPEQIVDLNALRISERLANNLQQAFDAIQALQPLLPTRGNLSPSDEVRSSPQRRIERRRDHNED